MPAHEGTNLGQRLAAMLHDMHVAKEPHVQRIRDEHKSRWVEQFMEAGETHGADWLGPIVKEITAHEDTPEWLRATLGRLTTPTEQFDFLYQLVAAPAVIMAIIFNIGTPMVQDVVNNLWNAHPDLPLSPADAALAMVRGEITADEAAGEAQLTGLRPSRFAVLAAITGEPPGPQELLSLFVRGVIDRDRLEHGIRQSRIRNEWIPEFTELAHVPPSAGEVMAGAVANQLPLDRARVLWGQNGMRDEDFDWVYQTTGPPPPTEQMIELWRRGDVTAEEVAEALLEGPVKNKWIPTIMKFKRRVPPFEQTIALTRRGIFTTDEATRHLRDLGFDEDVITAVIRWAQTPPTERHKELSESLTVRGYRLGKFGRDAAVTMLTGLGYDQAESAMVLDLADAEDEHREVEQAVTRVRSLYLAGKIDAGRASSSLDVLGVDPTIRDRHLRLWALERVDGTRELTLAQVTSIVKKDLRPVAWFTERVRAMGYDDEETGLLAELAGLAAPA